MAAAPYRYRILVTNTSPSPGGAANIFHVSNDVPLSDANVTSILNHLKTFYTAVGTYVYGAFSIGPRVLEYTPSGIAPRIVPVAAVGQTNVSSTPQPPQLAAVMSWRTALAGRSFRGRTFLGPLNLAALSSGALVGAFYSAANTAAATLITNVKTVTTAGYGLCVHSDHLALDTLITSGNMDPKVDTLRSRAS